MSEISNAEVEARLKQLEDRLRLTRIDVDRMQAEIVALRNLLSARSTASAATANPAKSTAPETARVPDAASATVRDEVAASVSPSRATPARDKIVSTAPITRAPAGPPEWWVRLTAYVKNQIGGIAVEEFVGLNLLNKVGILMLVIGGGFFLRIAYQWVGPEIKLAGLTLLASLALVGGEYYVRKSSGNFRLFGLGLAAGGSVLLFFNAFAAYHVDATRVIAPENSTFAYLLLLIVSGGIVANSLRYDSEAFTGFAYLLAFISISINESAASVERFTGHFALGALAILAASLILVISLRRWKFLGVLGLLGTYANFFWYATALPRTLEGFVWRGQPLTEPSGVFDFTSAGPDYFLFAFLYLLIYWIVFTVSVFTIQVDDRASRRVATYLNVANVLCFYLLVVYIRPPATEWGAFAITGGLGLACIAIAVLGRLTGRDYLWTSSVILGTGLLALAIPFRFSDYGLVFGWLIQSTVLAALGYRLREPLFRYAAYAILLANVGAFFDLDSGNLIYGYGPETLRDLTTGDLKAGVTPAVPLWTFDWNRGLLYCFMIPCFFGLQIFAALVSRYESETSADASLPVRTAADQVAWHSYGVLGTLVVFLFSHSSLLIGQQALLLVPCALLLLLPYRFLRLGPYLLYAVLLLWAALLSAAALIVVNEGPGQVVYQRLSLILLAVGGALVFFQYRRELAGDHGRIVAWRAPSPLPAQALAGLALWLPVVVLPSLAGYHVDPDVTMLGAALAAAGLVFVFASYRQGLAALILLSCFGFLFTAGVFLIGVFDGEPFETRFLWNGGWLLLAAISGAVGLQYYFGNFARVAMRGARMAFTALLAGSALVVLGAIYFRVPAPFGPATILAYALALATYLWQRRESSARLLIPPLGMLAACVGPLYWIVSGHVVTEAWREVLTVSVMPALAMAATVLLHPRASFMSNSAATEPPTVVRAMIRPRDWNAVVSLVLLLALVRLVFPPAYRPSGYALITLANYYILGQLQLKLIARRVVTDRGVVANPVASPIGAEVRTGDEWALLRRIAPVAFVFTLLSFAALLVDYSEAGDRGEIGLPLALRAIMGVAPLVLLAFSLGLHGALFGREDLTPFQRAGYPALLLALVLLTMSLIGEGWWSLAWAVLGVAALVGGILRNLKLLRYGGFALILLALLKLSLWDIRELESTARVVVLVCVGISFVVGSYFYARFRDTIFPKD